MQQVGNLQEKCRKYQWYWGVCMSAIFLMKAFFTGFCAAAAFGPVFIMTFNRAALHGMYFGIATAFGAALTDGMLFFLVMSGLLGKLVLSSHMLISLDILGALALFALSWNYWKTVQDVHERVSVTDLWELVLMVLKTFAMTMVNPSALLFFVFISMKLFGSELADVNVVESSIGGVAVMGGTFSALSLVSYVASFVGARLSPERLRKISRATAIFLIVIGCLLVFDAFSLVVWQR